MIGAVATTSIITESQALSNDISDNLSDLSLEFVASGPKIKT